MSNSIVSGEMSSNVKSAYFLQKHSQKFLLAILASLLAVQLSSIFGSRESLEPVISPDHVGRQTYNRSTAVESYDEGNKSVATPGIKGGFMGGFLSSFSMILVSELGDKTFFIAAIMVMKHSRWAVFGGTISALGLMTVLSALVGGYVTTLIPKIYTHCISVALFAFSGFQMLYNGICAEEEDSEEAEIEKELHGNDLNKEEGNKTWVFSPAFFHCFTMIFLSEWGDRSQLAIVVLAAREHLWGCCVGGVAGHALCSGLAVLGGRMISSKISVKTVTLIGGLVFLGFALVSMFLDYD